MATNSSFRRVLARAMALYVCASCYLSLTPLIAHDVLRQGSAVYGSLLAAVGIGSVLGGVVLSLSHRRAIPDDSILTLCSVAGALALGLLAFAHDSLSAHIALGLAGGSTLIQLAIFNAAAQRLLPESIRGRGLAIYMAATFGCMAAGSLLWGAVSESFSIRLALLLGALFYLVSAAGGRFAALTP